MYGKQFLFLIRHPSYKHKSRSKQSRPVATEPKHLILIRYKIQDTIQELSKERGQKDYKLTSDQHEPHYVTCVVN